MTAAWNATLDAIEFNLTATEAALTAGAPPPPATAVTVPAEALPAELADRARALAALTERLEERAGEHLERLRESLRNLPARRVGPAPVRTGHMVDVGA